jgi:adenylate cyclase
MHRSDFEHQLSVEEIRSQLDRILRHPEFVATKRMRNLFTHLVEETLAGNARTLKGYTIAIDVFGRDEDFDAARDPVVRVQASRLRQALERYYFIAGGDDPIRIDIPKGGYAAVFSAGPAGAGGADAGSYRSPEVVAATQPSVLVKPLQDYTRNPGLAYLGIGLATELAIELGNCGDLSVMLSGHESLDRAAPAFMPDFTVEGSVFAEGKSVKVIVQLVSSASGQQLWADTVKATLDEADLLSFQEKAATAIAAHIGGGQGVIFRTLSDSPQHSSALASVSYRAILKGYTYQQHVNGETYRAALEALHDARARDPDQGLVATLLALLYTDNISLEFFDIEQTPLDDALLLARAGTRNHPGNQLCRLVLARALMIADDLDAALEEVRAAHALRPDSLLFMDGVGYMMCLLGDWELGVRLADTAIRDNPHHHPYVRYAIWLNLFRKGEYAAALVESEWLKTFGYFWDPLSRAATLGQLGRTRQCTKAVDELLAIKPDFRERGQTLIHHYVKFPDIKSRILEGLAVGGLELKQA